MLIVFSSVLFIAYLSPAAFVVVVLLQVVRSRDIFGILSVLKRLSAALLVELDLFESLGHIFSGFKELKMDPKKNILTIRKRTSADKTGGRIASAVKRTDIWTLPRKRSGAK